jgi:hypothetical protein
VGEGAYPHTIMSEGMLGIDRFHCNSEYWGQTMVTSQSGSNGFRGKRWSVPDNLIDDHWLAPVAGLNTLRRASTAITTARTPTKIVSILLGGPINDL